MTAPIAGTTGWFHYDPQYNAVMTAAELDLFKRLQAGDPVLMGQYADKYGNPCSPSGFCGPALEAWQRDQDYWNVRYLNQLLPPEELARLQQYTGGAPFPYSLHLCNTLQQMQREGTLQDYLNGFADMKFASYIAQVCVGLTNVTVVSGGAGPVQVGTFQPTAPIGPQPTAPDSPTFVPTESGEGPTGTAQPPTPYGPIQPAPTDATGSGPTTVPTTAPTGTGTTTPGITPQTTATPQVPVIPVSTMGIGGGIPTWMWIAAIVVAGFLFLRGNDGS